MKDVYWGKSVLTDSKLVLLQHNVDIIDIYMQLHYIIVQTAVCLMNTGSFLSAWGISIHFLKALKVHIVNDLENRSKEAMIMEMKPWKLKCD